MQKLILPTQHAPLGRVELNSISISPYKRVGISDRTSTRYADSICVEIAHDSWEDIGKWVAFHTLILDDGLVLDWYEEEHFSAPLKEEGACVSGDDYSDISNLVYFAQKYQNVLSYQGLYEVFLKISDRDYSLVKNYFNLFKSGGHTSLQRQITDRSYWDIIIAYSIVESIIGVSPKCEKEISCSFHGGLPLKHNQYNYNEWLLKRLTEIIPEKEVREQYFEVIKDVYSFIRNPTVHDGSFPKAKFTPRDEGEVVFDLKKVQDSWKIDRTALLAIKLNISSIARTLLLNRIFSLKMFNLLKPLHVVTIKGK